jgi:hypothetical protein
MVSPTPLDGSILVFRALLMRSDYLLAKEKLHDSIRGQVENSTMLSRKAQLEAYDGCAALRPIWDKLASQYDAVITPSVIDVAPKGHENTGDAVGVTDTPLPSV